MTTREGMEQGGHLFSPSGSRGTAEADISVSVMQFKYDCVAPCSGPCNMLFV